MKMKIEREKLKTTLKGESAANLKIENTIVETPTPMLTTTDINYAAGFSDDDVELRYPHKLHEIREVIITYGDKSMVCLYIDKTSFCTLP